MNQVGIFKITGDPQEPFKFCSGPWSADRTDEVIAAAKQGYPTFGFTVCERRLLEGVSPLGNPVSRFGYDAPVEVDGAA